MIEWPSLLIVAELNLIYLQVSLCPVKRMRTIQTENCQWYLWLLHCPVTEWRWRDLKTIKSALSRTLPLSLSLPLARNHSHSRPRHIRCAEYYDNCILLGERELVLPRQASPAQRSPAQWQGKPRKSRKPSHWNGRRLRQWNFAASYNPPRSRSLSHAYGLSPSSVCLLSVPSLSFSGIGTYLHIYM